MLCFFMKFGMRNDSLLLLLFVFFKQILVFYLIEIFALRTNTGTDVSRVGVYA